MHAVLVTLGTDGDVYPYIGLGQILKARGHRVTLAANEHHAETARRLGFEFETLLWQTEYDRLIDNPDIWHPWKSALVGARLGVELLERHYTLVERLSRGPDSVLVVNPGVLPGRLVQEKHGRPLAQLMLQPFMFASIH